MIRDLAAFPNSVLETATDVLVIGAGIAGLLGRNSPHTRGAPGCTSQNLVA